MIRPIANVGVIAAKLIASISAFLVSVAITVPIDRLIIAIGNILHVPASRMLFRPSFFSPRLDVVCAVLIPIKRAMAA